MKTLRRLGAFLFCLVCAVFFLAETYAVFAVVIPYVSISMFQETGIAVAEGLTLAEFSIGDMIVLCMMWLFPALAAVALITAAQWKFLCFIAHYVRRFCKVAFALDGTPSTAAAAVTVDVQEPSEPQTSADSLLEEDSPAQDDGGNAEPAARTSGKRPEPAARSRAAAKSRKGRQR